MVMFNLGPTTSKRLIDTSRLLLSFKNKLFHKLDLVTLPIHFNKCPTISELFNLCEEYKAWGMYYNSDNPLMGGSGLIHTYPMKHDKVL